jgi:hypothetical protein
MNSHIGRHEGKIATEPGIQQRRYRRTLNTFKNMTTRESVDRQSRK